MQNGNGNGAKWKARSWKTSEFDQSALEKTPRFSIPNFRFGYGAKRKARSEKPRKTDSPGFPSFQRTPSFRPRRKIQRD